MPTDNEFAALYNCIRTEIVSRHFLLGRYFWAGLVSQDVNKIAPSGTVESITCLPRSEQAIPRWRIRDHDRENPLIGTGKLIACLAIEYELGHKEALPLLRIALDSVDKLFKFRSNTNYAGYIIRHDAVTSDHWELTSDQSPNLCMDFLPDRTGHPFYCTSLTDPRYDRNGGDETRKRYRVWEPSMDELLGLLAGYSLAFDLVPLETVRPTIERQVRDIAQYLASHCYLLVRPGGQFAFRGAAGVLPALAYPFGCIFRKILGDEYAPTVSFEDAMEDAGVWEELKWPMRAAGLGGILVAVGAATGLGLLLPTVAGIIGGLGLLSALPAYHLGRACALLAKKSVFDVQERSQSEFALAYLFSKVPGTSGRFSLYFQGVSIAGNHDAALTFPNLVGLSAVRGDATVRSAYLDWYSARSKRNIDDENIGTRNILSVAVAAACGAGGDADATLRSLLDKSYVEADNYLLPLGPARDENDPTFWEVTDNTVNADAPLSYMLSLALAWLRRRDLANSAGIPINTAGTSGDLPLAPTSAEMAWENPAVPDNVVTQALWEAANSADPDILRLPGINEEPLTGAMEKPSVTHGEGPRSNVLVDAAGDPDQPLEEHTTSRPDEPPRMSQLVERTISYVIEHELGYGWDLGATSKTESYGHVLLPPPLPADSADQYSLKVTEERDPATVNRSVELTYRILDAPVVLFGISFGEPNDVVLNITLHTGALRSYRGYYKATWTLTWVDR